MHKHLKIQRQPLKCGWYWTKRTNGKWDKDPHFWSPIYQLPECFVETAGPIQPPPDTIAEKETATQFINRLVLKEFPWEEGELDYRGLEPRDVEDTSTELVAALIDNGYVSENKRKGFAAKCKKATLPFVGKKNTTKKDVLKALKQCLLK